MTQGYRIWNPWSLHRAYGGYILQHTRTQAHNWVFVKTVNPVWLALEGKPIGNQSFWGSLGFERPSYAYNEMWSPLYNFGTNQPETSPLLHTMIWFSGIFFFGGGPLFWKPIHTQISALRNPPPPSLPSPIGSLLLRLSLLGVQSLCQQLVGVLLGLRSSRFVGVSDFWGSIPPGVLFLMRTLC